LVLGFDYGVFGLVFVKLILNEVDLGEKCVVLGTALL